MSCPDFPFSGERFSPPRDIHAPNYPSRGCYSSRDPKVLRQHMAEMREAGIGVAVVSWWGPEWRDGTTDQQVRHASSRR